MNYGLAQLCYQYTVGKIDNRDFTKRFIPLYFRSALVHRGYSFVRTRINEDYYGIKYNISFKPVMMETYAFDLMIDFHEIMNSRDLITFLLTYCKYYLVKSIGHY